MSGNETTSNQRHFYPRPPQGGRHSPVLCCRRSEIFLSTPSARRATFVQRYGRCPVCISIHALRKEGDRIFSDPTKVFPISIHALRKEGDRRHRGRV